MAQLHYEANSNGLCCPLSNYPACLARMATPSELAKGDFFLSSMMLQELIRPPIANCAPRRPGGIVDVEGST
jgi:hypothetical protein